MALDPVKFHTNSGGGRQIHSYNSAADNLATCIAANYFTPITDRLHVGDIIHLVHTASSAQTDLFVSAISPTTGAVTVIGAT
jgi:hypothetical protein